MAMKRAISGPIWGGAFCCQQGMYAQHTAQRGASVKTRILHTKFWKDTFVAELTPSEKLIFLYLLTNERVNIIHCYECSDREILFDTGATKDVLESAKAKLSASGKVQFFQGYVFLANADKYEQYRGELSQKGRETQEREMSPEIFSWYKANLEGGFIPPTSPQEGDQKGTINNKQETINKKEGGVGETKIHARLTYLDAVPEEDAHAMSEKYGVTVDQVRAKAEELADYCRSKGKTYRDYRAFLGNCLRKDVSTGKLGSTKGGEPAHSPERPYVAKNPYQFRTED
jgi:hypothetical protein